MKRLISISIVSFLLLTIAIDAQAHFGWGRCNRPYYRGYYIPRPMPYIAPPAPVFRDIWIEPHWRRTRWGDEWIPGHWRRQRIW